MPSTTRRILVVGTSTFNKGAELMHAAVQQQLARRSELRAVVQASFGTHDDRLRFCADAYVAPDRFYRDRLWRRLMHGQLRTMLGLAWDDDLHAVIDASGFAFSDHLGVKRIQSAAKDFARWHKQGKKIVLLPQALGPFEVPDVRAAMGSICESASLVYARDRTSFQHLQRFTGSSAKFRLAPDFTCLVERRPKGLCDAPKGGFCVVPNMRMVTNTTAAVAARYEGFLRQCIQQFQDDGVPTWILVHDRGDFDIAERLVQNLNRKPIIWHHDDACTIKTALGQADMVLASRFHALVSALSLGVASVATSWSFKYQELMSDFGVPDHIVDISIDPGELAHCLRRAWQTRKQTSAVLLDHSNAARMRAREMWQEVRSVLAM